MIHNLQTEDNKSESLHKIFLGEAETNKLEI